MGFRDLFKSKKQRAAERAAEELAAKKQKEAEELAAKKRQEEAEEEQVNLERKKTFQYDEFLDQLSEKIKGNSSRAGVLWTNFSPIEKKAAVILWIEKKINKTVDISNIGEKRLVEYTVDSIDKKGLGKRNHYSEFVEYALDGPLFDYFSKESSPYILENTFYIIGRVDDNENASTKIRFDFSYTDYKNELGAFYRNPDFWKLLDNADGHARGYILRIFAAVKEEPWGYKLINGGMYYPAGLSEEEKNNPNLETIWNIVEENATD